jgi:hypothetical protein
MSAATSLLPDPTMTDLESAPPAPDDRATTVIQRHLDAVAGLRLYADNPFRCLGLPALSGPREIARRIEALQSPKRAKAGGDWAFAPRALPTPDQLNACLGSLQSGGSRLLAELFWFWPEKYPEETSDAGVDALAAGDVESAYNFWLGASEQGSVVADHNLAVMFHYAALDREIEGGAIDDEALAWWSASAHHWTRAIAGDELWARLAARAKRLEDPDLPATAVSALRARVAGAIARLQSTIALTRAERGDEPAAAALANLLHAGPLASRATEHEVSMVLEPKVREIGHAIEQAEEAITGDDRPCLAHVEELLRGTVAPRRTVELIAGAGSELVGRIYSRLVEVGSAGVVENARRTGDGQAGLPFLVGLAVLPARTEARRRISELRSSAIEQAVKRTLGAGASADPAARYSALLTVISESLAPAVERFSWDKRLQSAYLARVIAELRELAHEAHRQLGEFDLSSQAFGVATELADEETRPVLMRERKQLWQQFQRAQKGAVQIEHNRNLLELDARRIAFNGREVTVDAITGLRFGLHDGIAGQGPRIAWSMARESVELDAANLLDPTDGAGERFRQIVEALDACVIPVLADRMVKRLRAGQSFVLGHSALRPEGFVFQRRPGQLGASEAVPYTRLTQTISDGALVLAEVGNPASTTRYPLAEVWNAVLMLEVLPRLAALE